VAIETPTRAGGSFGQANIGVPQRAQLRRWIRGDVGALVVSPDQAKSVSRKMARAKNGAPVQRWHSRQWHTRTLAGSALARHRTWPQRQPPS
jgi:hypothetical protein